MASGIGIANINWNNVCNDQAGHAKNTNEAEKEVRAKSNAFAEARIKFAVVKIHCNPCVPIVKLRTITHAWSASKVE